jgi:predicted AlkP superfamily pyrophosphatase or phosphodiesterase
MQQRILENSKWFIGRSLLILIISFAISVCTHSSSSGDKQANADGKLNYNAVLVVIDGARYTETFGDPTHQYIPYMWKYLKPQGTNFENFSNDGETKTNPGMTSLITGTWQHVKNDGSERPTAPTFFEYFRYAVKAPESAALDVAGKSKLNICSYSTHADYGAPYGAREDVDFNSDIETYQALISHLQDVRPRLVLVNLSEVDWDGHSGEWASYTDAIQTADSLVWELWQFLQSNSFYAGKTYLFVTNDHGRNDDRHGGFKNHGCDCEGCRHLMLFALGPDVRKDHVVRDAYSQIDICPTFGALLGFDTPFADGEIITGFLAGGKDAGKPQVR